MLVLLAVLKFALSSPLGAEQAQKDAAALSAVLTEALRQPVQTAVVPHDELPRMLASGQVDLAWLSASQYLRAAPSVPVAKLVRSGLTFYRSAIFTHRGGAKKLSDLKGKRIAFVSEGSGAGHLMALRVLMDAGFKQADLRGQQFLGDHAAVCRAVVDGKADAGATFANDGRGGSLAGCEETIGAAAKKLRVLATSDPIPNDLIAARPDLPADVLSEVRAALLALRGPRAAVFHADGFVPAADADYAGLRR